MTYVWMSYCSFNISFNIIIFALSVFFSISLTLMSSSGCLLLSVSCWMCTGGSGCVARFTSARWGLPWPTSASPRNHQLARDDGLVCQGWAVPSIVVWWMWIRFTWLCPGFAYFRKLAYQSMTGLTYFSDCHLQRHIFFQDTEGVPDVRCFINGW